MLLCKLDKYLLCFGPQFSHLETGDWTRGPLAPGLVRIWGKGSPVPTFIVPAESGGLVGACDFGGFKLFWEAWIPGLLSPVHHCKTKMHCGPALLFMHVPHNTTQHITLSKCTRPVL